MSSHDVLDVLPLLTHSSDVSKRDLYRNLFRCSSCQCDSGMTLQHTMAKPSEPSIVRPVQAIFHAFGYIRIVAGRGLRLPYNHTLAFFVKIQHFKHSKLNESQ